MKSDPVYEVVLPASRISLSYRTPTAEPNYIALTLHSPDGDAVDSLTFDEPEWDDPENPGPLDEVDPDGDWRLLSELFSEVHRHVLGWDKIVSDVQKALATSGSIGGGPRR